MEEHRQQVSELLAAQKAARVDLLRTQVRLADLRQQIVAEENVLAVEKRALANLLGLEEGGGRLTLAGDLVFEEVSWEAEELYREALAGRSDYLGAEAELAAREKRVAIARADYRPTVSLRGSYGLRTTLEAEQEDVGALGVVMSLPLFEGGRRGARVREELANVRAARERLRGLRLQIRQEIETAALNIDASTVRIEATRTAIDEAQEGLRIERLKYELGEGSITDVFDAQAALLQTETNYYRALADFRTALAQVDLATGKKGRKSDF
jgi:outer membrane protein TolC